LPDKKPIRTRLPLLRLGGKRRGEEAARHSSKEGSSLHHSMT
jgi:hypothetical protein